MGFDLPLLFAAGFIGGILNSIAGGGSFITFPALLFVGVPPIMANATNTFASCSGYLSGAYAFREELREQRKELPKFILISFIGGITGAWLLLQTPETVFREIIPWLLLFATLIFTFGERLNALMSQIATQHAGASAVGKYLSLLLFLGICIYGGFFNAGQGIIALSYLALVGYTNINAMNGLKLMISSCVAIVAIAIFIANGSIAWSEGSIVLLGTLTGGYMAARVSRKVNQIYLRNFVIVASSLITGYFFFDLYGR